MLSKLLKKGRKGANRYHVFHILTENEIPFLTSLSTLLLVYGLLFWFYTGRVYILLLGTIMIIYAAALWWMHVFNESIEHTKEIMLNLRFGMFLFILSEVMFFFSFFWAFFDVSMAPGVEIGAVWPPVGLEDFVINPWSIPTLNTLLLLSSGVAVTGAHHSFNYAFNYRLAFKNLSLNSSIENILKKHIILYRMKKDSKRIIFKIKKRAELGQILTTCFRVSQLFKAEILGIEYMMITIFLAALFTACQAFEYVESLICISDSVYGSTFFLLTGFHGLHVIIGTIFLITVTVVTLFSPLYRKPNIGLECSIWYWHFVDVVWLLLFISIYIWGNTNGTGALMLSSGQLESFPVSKLAVNFDQPMDGRIGFQDAATPVMEGIVDLHHGIMIIVVFLTFFVTWLLVGFTMVRRVFCHFQERLVRNILLNIKEIRSTSKSKNLSSKFKL